MSRVLKNFSQQTKRQIIDAYFLEHRAKMIDLAAYLDRVDRGAGDDSQLDFRHLAFRQALEVLLSDQPHRAKRILEILSVTDSRIPESAAGMKGATGAAPPIADS